MAVNKSKIIHITAIFYFEILHSTKVADKVSRELSYEQDIKNVFEAFNKYEFLELKHGH